MPTYRYRAVEDTDCADCLGFEIVQRISEEPLTACPTCGAEIRRVIGKIECLTNRRWNTKKMLADGNLRRLGFKKLEKQSDGKYVDVLRSD